MIVEAAEVLSRNTRDDYGRHEIRQGILDLVARIHGAEPRIHVLEKSVEMTKTSSLATLVDYLMRMADSRRRTRCYCVRGEPLRLVMTSEE
jgi:hypothetical protein